MRSGSVAVAASTEPAAALFRSTTPAVYCVPAPESVSYTRGACMFVPSLNPAAVPVAGSAAPNDELVPPPPPEVTTRSAPVESTWKGA